MAEGTNYKIRIEGAGLSLDREVSKEIGEKVVVLLLTGESIATSSSSAVAPFISEQEPVPSAETQFAVCEPEMSIREFLDLSEVKRCPDKITAIGIYLKDYCDTADFCREDLIKNFENAAESVPKNLSRDIKWAQKAGWITLRNGSKDRYYVTNSGQKAVAQKFSKEVVEKSKGLASGSKKTTAKNSN